MAPVFVLTETSAGYVLLKAKDKKILKNGDIAEKTKTATDTAELLKLKEFSKFESAASALQEAAALGESKVTAKLSSLLDSLKDEKKATLAVADKNLANAINKLPGLDLKLVADSSTDDLFRAIREHLPALLPGLKPEELTTTSLGLSHSLSRHKLKFSADKVDIMIIQAIGLLDDLDKELNMYAMRVKEWYGWHFPEMARIINDNLAYARIVLKMGMRENAKEADLSEILPEEIEIAVKAAAEVSMGTEITPDDLEKIQLLAEQVVSFTEYRSQLSSYLTSRMQAIAPNLTTIVGELVGARLIQHAGSLQSLCKNPASTIQILGSEKALFRALKTKHDTPKYGLIYHASLVGQASGKNKGKIARVLAAKAALGIRVDSLSEWGADQEHEDGAAAEPTEEERAAVGLRARAYVERRLRALEGRALTQKGAAIAPTGSLAAQPSKFSIKEARKYNPDADGLAGNEPSTTPKPSKPLIQEVPDVVMTNGQATAGAEASDSDEDSDEEEAAETRSGRADGATEKAQRKAEKAARKAARAEKRRLKEEKRAKKEGKRAKKEAAESEATETKKRKRDDGEEKGEKKKKKKQKNEA